MTLLIRIVLFLLAALALGGSIFFLTRSFGARTLADREGYNVARMNAQRLMKRFGYISGAFLLAALVLFFSGLLYTGESSPAASEPAAIDLTVTPGEVTDPVLTATVPLVEAAPSDTPPPTATTAAALATPAPPPTVTPAPTQELVRAIVNSPLVGLYLRTAPNGEIVERLDDQAELILLGEEQVVEGLLWVRVGSQAGQEGWVAADYLLIGSEIPPTAEAAPEIPVEATPSPESDGG